MFAVALPIALSGCGEAPADDSDDSEAVTSDEGRPEHHTHSGFISIAVRGSAPANRTVDRRAKVTPPADPISDVLAMLRNVRELQLDARKRCLVDRNGDRTGEFGVTDQLGLLLSEHGDLHTISGHYLQIFVPSQSGSWTAESHDADPQSAAERWCCFAWPSVISGWDRLYYADPRGIWTARSALDVTLLAEWKPHPESMAPHAKRLPGHGQAPAADRIAWHLVEMF